MMLLVRSLVVMAAITGASAQTGASGAPAPASSGDRPLEKVIKLLEDLKTEVAAEGTAEAESYDKFACFCKDTTEAKATSITEGQDKIDDLSATIASDTATKAAKQTLLNKGMAEKEELSSELQSETTRCATEKAKFEATEADLHKAISSLAAAKKAMEDKKTAIDAVSFYQVDSGLKETLDLADALDLIKTPKQKAFLQGFSTSLLQQKGSKVDPENSGYTYKSSDIVALLESLHTDFTKEKETLEAEWDKTDAACIESMDALNAKLGTNADEMDTTTSQIEELGQGIAEARGQLVEAQGLMKDDEQYMKDLTTRCEDRANDWDQRSSMRAKEIEAISTALTVLTDKASAADTAVNARVLLQNPEKAASPVAPKSAETEKAKAAPKANSEPTKAKAASEPAKASTKAALSFLQRVADVSDHLSKEAQEQRAKDDAITAIKTAGLHLKSPVLTALAMRVAADPFKKVKNLIQGLIERLIREAASEATKKGFCDTELGKAEKDRTFRWERVNKLQAEIQVLQAKEDFLNEEIDSLTTALTTLDQSLVDTAEERTTQKDDNMATIKTAKEGLEAVKEALLILRTFYKEAAKAALLQTSESPVDADTANPGAGFSGSYKGKQQSSNAVLALLETVASDFDRTVRTTQSSESTAAKMYVKFVQTTKAEIAGKTTKKALDEQDLKTTSNKLEVDRADMKTNMNLVDDAVRTLMELKPTCIDTGMSYSERVQKREEEIAALKSALCILDTENVESDC